MHIKAIKGNRCGNIKSHCCKHSSQMRLINCTTISGRVPVLNQLLIPHWTVAKTIIPISLCLPYFSMELWFGLETLCTEKDLQAAFSTLPYLVHIRLGISTQDYSPLALSTWAAVLPPWEQEWRL